MPLGIFKLNSISKSSALIPKATGGTISTVTARQDFLSGTSSTRNYILHTFGVGTSTLTVSQLVTVEYLIIAGGGCGAWGRGGDSVGYSGGGGGAGGVTHGSITLTPGNYTITVGAGGAPLEWPSVTVAQNSSAFGITSGAGGTNQTAAQRNGTAGSGGGNSGSGCGATDLAYTGGISIGGTGRFNGGSTANGSLTAQSTAAGGGGGQAGNGGNGVYGITGTGGAGGAGIQLWFNSTNVTTYGVGGGGGGGFSLGNSQGTPGSGGGGGVPNAAITPAQGSNGIVLVRY
jgi:hypothetical protein